MKSNDIRHIVNPINSKGDRKFFLTAPTASEKLRLLSHSPGSGWGILEEWYVRSSLGLLLVPRMLGVVGRTFTSRQLQIITTPEKICATT